MVMTTNKLVKKMFQEYSDFKAYVHMYEKADDTSAKNEIKKIAEDEMHHYKRIYDLVFGRADSKKMSDIESSVYEYATHLYREMTEDFNELR